jgi:hypothetical protein
MVETSPKRCALLSHEIEVIRMSEVALALLVYVILRVIERLAPRSKPGTVLTAL